VRFLTHRHVHLRYDLRAHAAGTDHRRKQCFDTLRVVVLEPMDHVELLFTQGELVVATGGGQQPSLLVDHGDLGGFHIRDAGGHEIHDGLHLALLETPARLHLHEHRGTGRVLIAYERRLARNGKVYSRAFDGTQVRDRAAELGFQRMLVARVLHELADSEAGVLVHESEATTAFRQALAGELHTRFAHPLGGNFDVVRARLDAIRNLRRIQCLGDLRLVFGRNVGVEQAVARAARPQDDGHAGGHRGGDADE